MMKKIKILFGLGVVFLMSGCGLTADTTSVNTLPTPTPLPTPIVPEKPQYTVQQGTVVNALTFNGRVSPVNEAQLSFETSGVVSRVTVGEGDDVTAGTILAELNIAEQEQAIQEAEQALIEAQRNLDVAEQEHAEKILTAEIALQKSILSGAQGGDNGQNLLTLQKNVENAQATVNSVAQLYQEAIADPNSNQAYVDSLSQQLQQVEQDLLVAEDNLANGQRSGNSTGLQDLERIKEERDYLKLLEGIGPELQWAVEKAEDALLQAQSNLQNAQLVAPFDGRVLSVSIRRGTSAEPFKTVIIMAQLDALEITANLNASDLEKLSVNQVAQIALLNRPEETLSGSIRTLPYPYGSGGAGNANTEERVVRIQLDGNTALTLGELAEVTIILQEKEDVLWLPPTAIRKFQGRNFVVVQLPDAQQRVDVRLGIESEERVEILEGLEEGQIILGE